MTRFTWTLEPANGSRFPLPQHLNRLREQPRCARRTIIVQRQSTQRRSAAAKPGNSPNISDFFEPLHALDKGGDLFPRPACESGKVFKFCRDFVVWQPDRRVDT